MTLASICESFVKPPNSDELKLTSALDNAHAERAPNHAFPGDTVLTAASGSLGSSTLVPLVGEV
jgi:hypothetical protein